MCCFVDFVSLCSRIVGTGQDEPEDPVSKRDVTESDLGTGDNEDNEEESNSLSLCVSQSLAVPSFPAPMPLQTRFNPAQDLGVH
jgi:hypothetical protein